MAEQLISPALACLYLAITLEATTAFIQQLTLTKARPLIEAWKRNVKRMRVMQTQLTKIIEEMQQRAKTCETASADSTEEALTGESSSKDKNTQDAKEWMIRSKVWIEAEAIVAGCLSGKTDRVLPVPAGVTQCGEGESEL